MQAAVQKLNPTFIGSLSRFASLSIEGKYKYYDAIVVLSGPEPQRSHFEKIIFQQLQTLPITAIIAKGTPQHPIQSSAEIVFSHHIFLQMKCCFTIRIVITSSAEADIQH